MLQLQVPTPDRKKGGLYDCKVLVSGRLEYF